MAAPRREMTGGFVLPVAAAILSLAGCGPPPRPLSRLPEPPAHLMLDRHYQKYIDAAGIPVVSSRRVPDRALHEAKRLLLIMMSRSDVRERVVGARTLFAVIGAREVLTDIPEYRNLYQQFPGTDWNKRARGLGATEFIRVTSASQENLLCGSGDTASILIHEFAHTILNLGVDDERRAEVRDAYADAILRGLWANTYAGTNADEYWAEGARACFDTNRQADPPNGVHNSVNRRTELQVYDPRLAGLLAKVLPIDDWRYTCPE